MCVHSYRNLTSGDKWTSSWSGRLAAASWGKAYKLSHSENRVEDSGLLGCDTVMGQAVQEECLTLKMMAKC